MVNLNRQIRATQARQGGFSSHVLPEAVGYQAERFIVYAAGGTIAVTDPSLIITNKFGGPFTPVTATDGGPFGEPHTTSLDWMASAPAPYTAPEPFTIEFWYLITAQATQSIRFGQLGRMSVGDTNVAATGGGRKIVFTAGAPGPQQAVYSDAVYGEWRHFALTFRDNKILTFDNGSLMPDITFGGGTVSIGGGIEHASYPVEFRFGDLISAETTSEFAVGQLRIMPDRILYNSASFTPPTAPFIAV